MLASRKPQTYQGRTVIQDESDDDDDDDSDWDLEPELEIAKVQQASLLHRRIPSLRKQQAPVVSQSTPSKPKGSSPYYCEEVGPQLDLGYQWPQDLSLQKSRGFRKVSPGNNISRQRDVDRRLLTNRHKVRKKKLCL